MSRCPHARGGVPKLSENELNGLTVVPTHVGVFRLFWFTRKLIECCPHARGGVPVRTPLPHTIHALSPRTWGCSCWAWSYRLALSVVPTHVGVFRLFWFTRKLIECCPHARGGVPVRTPLPHTIHALSPRTWGCSCWAWSYRLALSVVPTHVGVFRLFWFTRKLIECCPHARGGVPVRTPLPHTIHALSPRTWGCSCLRER
jgi:hypothetical protein